ncbi:MAG: NAD-dependent epimerase/dehydratase family protein, partial [Candidatus Kapaibacteriota bacterium]
KMCESYNLQYGTNFISVMPTNLYGPYDNFDLLTSHVIPALLRKVHLGKLLENNDWEGIRKDLNKYPIEGVDGNSSQEEILNILSKYGIKANHSAVQIEVWGSGNPRREFMWVDDMADACVFIMENVDFKDLVDPSSKEVRNTHINIGTGEDISIKELAYLIKEIVGFK